MTLVRTVSRPAADPDDQAWEPVYDAFVKHLVALDAGGSAPRIADPFPDFSLPDPHGVYRSLSDLVSEGPLVLSFNRGGWCPYCSHELTLWGEQASALKAAGGRLVVVSGELGERAAALKGMSREDAIVLCDVDHGVALAAGLACHLSAELNDLYLKAGLDLATIYGSGGGFLPIPATFVIDRDRMIRYAFVDPDFRYRANPPDVVRFLDAMD